MLIPKQNISLYSNKNKKTAERILTDDSAVWSGSQCPSYVDIDLDGEYRLEKILVDTGKGYSKYFIFSSDNGCDYSLCGEKSDESEADGYISVPVCASSVRIYIRYNSVSNDAVIRYVELHGEKIGEKKEKKTITMPCDFKDSVYNVDITEKDTVDEVYNVIKRNIGEEYTDRFIFEIENNGKIFYEISDCGEKIKIKGNDGVSLCTGLNHYLKYYCRVNISQVGTRSVMPEKTVPVGETVHRQTPFKVRYAYNYCALSYTMAFWDSERWQKELDWLALSGMNVILDITAMEEVWRRFLQRLGYSHREIKDFICGPAYSAWFNMANIYGIGSPVHDSFFEKRTDLARKNHLFMQKMGMQPVLQGYSGMMPNDIAEKIPEAQIIPQGDWNGLPRPAMLKTTTEVYKNCAKIFYECQKEVFGDISDYYAVDPFHEGGTSGGLSPEEVSRTVISSLLENNENAIWIIQSWGENPTRKLLDGLEGHRDHALILDLYAEKRPRWETWLDGEFNNTPWVYCMLNNFGGRMGLHGHIRTVAREVSRAYKKAEYMRGIGITPEATLSNPIIFDLFFETAWGKEEPEEIDLEKWFREYALRRYGECSDDMFKAIKILNDTVYNPELNEKGEGAPESVINARPAFKIKAASSWGNAVVAYDKAEFEKAVALFFRSYDGCKDSEGYIFDLCDLLKQILSNRAQTLLAQIKKAYLCRSKEKFKALSEEYLGLIRYTDSVLSYEKTFTLGNWTQGALKWAEDTDDFSRMLYLFTAKALITTWAGDRKSAEAGGLRDYSNKQWNALTMALYYKRWEKFFSACLNKLEEGKRQDIDYFALENDFTWDNDAYKSSKPEKPLSVIAREILGS